MNWERAERGKGGGEGDGGPGANRAPMFALLCMTASGYDVGASARALAGQRADAPHLFQTPRLPWVGSAWLP